MKPCSFFYFSVLGPPDTRVDASLVRPSRFGMSIATHQEIILATPAVSAHGIPGTNWKRWRHMIRNPTKKTEKKKKQTSRLSIFHLRAPELSNFDLQIGFPVQHCIYRASPKIRSFQTLEPKNVIFYRTSPPYSHCPITEIPTEMGMFYMILLYFALPHYSLTLRSN